MWHRGGRATHRSPHPQATMGQWNIESSTAGTQPPRQGHLRRVHSSYLMAQQIWDKGTVGHPGTVWCSWDTGMRLSRSETAFSRARSLVRQRQAGQCFLPLHVCPVRLGTVGSDRAVLTGHSAATTTSHQVGCQHSLKLEQLKKAKLHVEMAIKVRDLISHPSNATCLHFWLRRAEPEEPGLEQAEPTGLCAGEEDLHGTGRLPRYPPPAASPGLGGEEAPWHGQTAGAALW